MIYNKDNKLKGGIKMKNFFKTPNDDDRILEDFEDFEDEEPLDEEEAEGWQDLIEKFNKD